MDAQFTNSVTENTIVEGNMILYAKWQTPIGDRTVPASVGDIVFTDGSAMTPTDSTTLTDDQKTAAVGVVAYKYSENEYLIIAKKYSTGKVWATSKGKCYTTTPEALVSTNDEDGSDNWAIIQAADPENTTDEKMNTVYPAFSAAKDYGKNFTGKFSEGWYLPSVGELQRIYGSRSACSTGISKAGGTQASLPYKSLMKTGSYAYQVYDYYFYSYISSNGSGDQYYVVGTGTNAGVGTIDAGLIKKNATSTSKVGTYQNKTTNTCYILPVYRLKLN